MKNLDENASHVIEVVWHFVNLYFLLFPTVQQCANTLAYPGEFVTFSQAFDQGNFGSPIKKRQEKS